MYTKKYAIKTTPLVSRLSKDVCYGLPVVVFALFAVFGFGLVTGNNQKTSIGMASASAQEPADINNDNVVNIFDLSTLLSKWNTNDTISDLNHDGTVNIFDLSTLLSKWGAVSAGTGCAVGEVGTAPNCYPAPPAPLDAGKQWKMLFNDEFDGTTLNLSNFTPCFDWNYGNCSNSFNDGRERYLPSQVQVSNGTAKLIAEPLIPAANMAGCYNSSCTYKAGLISTARPHADDGSAYLHPFTYGYVEARVKYPSQSGFFTAFWMLPTNTDYTYRSEIDIVEILGGNADTVFMTYHYNNRSQHHFVNDGNQNNGSCQVKDYSQNFVRFGMDWQPTHVAWYIDGVKCGQFDGDATTIENGPMQIILHLMVDNDWQRDWGLTLQDLNQTAQLEVDYLRVYQQQE